MGEHYTWECQECGCRLEYADPKPPSGRPNTKHSKLISPTDPNPETYEIHDGPWALIAEPIEGGTDVKKAKKAAKTTTAKSGKGADGNGREPMTKTEILPCKLTDSEFKAKARELAVIETVAQRKLDDEQSAAKAEWKKRQDELDSSRARLSREIDTGVEHRQVSVRMDRDLPSNAMRYVRTDTGEVYHERPLTAEERQGKLFMGGAGASAPAGPEA